MWMIEALAEVPFKKPFFVMWSTLGAASLLLSYLLGADPLVHRFIFMAFACVSLYLWHTGNFILNGLLVPLIASAAWVLLPHHMLLFCLLTSFVFGKLLFADQFRLWKWLTVAALLTVTFPILFSWEDITRAQTLVPYPWTIVIQSAVLAFCVTFALLPYQIRKDSVHEAFDLYAWKTSTDAFRLCVETVDLYDKIKQLMKAHEQNAKIREDLEDYTERVIHQCFQLQQIHAEISSISIASLEKQIVTLKEKLESVDDTSAKQQYEQALANKQKQVEQFEGLRRSQDRLHSQVLNYNSSLENIRLAYSHQDLMQSSAATENVEMFMDAIKARAEGFHATP
jgi:hypothetical protein